jgi:succinyl-diaminopimelate desuccinylase
MPLTEIVELTKALIRFKSVSADTAQVGACADFICSYLDRHRITYLRRTHNGVPSIAALPADTFAGVLLMAHFDVVAGPDPLFEPVERNGRLYGRGSIDDKYAVALSLVLLKNHLVRLRDQGRDQTGLPFGILLTGDEEVGGYNGAKHALEHIRTDFCIALDGGAPERIVIREKGILRLRLTTRGKAAHGARPWLGINAIEQLVADYQQIKSFFEQQTPDHWHRTLNWGMVRAGRAVNQVPDEAEALLDIRYTEKDDPAALVEQMRRRISGTLEIMELEPLFISGDAPQLARLKEAAPAARTVFEHGASDARFLSVRDVPGVVWGADGEMSQHGDDEHVVIDSIERLYRSLEAFLSKTGGPDLTR